MAVVGSFIHVSDMRGKIGGNVFSRGKSGHTVRVRVKPSNPRTSAQSNVRSLMADGARFFKDLAAEDLALWRDYAASLTFHNRVSGAAYAPTAINALTQLYVPFFLASPAGTFPDVPPTTPFTGDVITLTAVGDDNMITFTGSAQQTAGIKTEFLIQRLKSPNRLPSPEGYTIASIAAVPATPFEVDITDLTPGFYAVGYKFIKTATGQETLPVFLGIVEVTAP